MTDEPRSPSEAVARATVTIDPGEEFKPPEKGASKRPPAVAEGMPAPEPKVADLPPWSEKAVREALSALTVTLHAGAGGVVGAELAMTDDELDAIVPPLTNIINRTPKLRAMSSASDVVTLALGMLGYSMRVVDEAATTRRDRRIEAQRRAEIEAGRYENVEPSDGMPT